MDIIANSVSQEAVVHLTCKLDADAETQKPRQRPQALKEPSP
jgi:hypothetical protein